MTTDRRPPLLALAAALIVLAVFGLTAAACASRESRIRVLPPVLPPESYVPSAPAPLPAPVETPAAASSLDVVPAEAAATAVVRAALSVLGAPYRDGGALPDGFDCSGLVSYVFGRSGIAVPRDVRQQATAGRAVSAAAILPGDLLFFATTGPGPTHVAIAIGGDRFIHAPKNGAVVRIESLASGYWAPRFLDARRLVPDSDPEKRRP